MSKAFRRIGYLRFGRIFEPWIEEGKFEPLNRSIQKAGLDISLRAYLGMMVFGAFLGFFGGLGITGIVTFIILEELKIFPDVIQTLIASIMAAILGGAITAAIVFLIFIESPRTKAADRKIMIEAGLASTASYLSAMSSSGVPPDRLFYSLAAEEAVSSEISKEAKRITRDIEIFGYDILRALRASSFRSPSNRYSKFIDGMTATITSGGDLTFYLSSESKALMKLKEEETKEFIEQLGVIAEIFMIVGVVSPLFFVVIIAILSVIASGGGSLASMLMILMTYFLMPVLMVVMLLLLSTASREM